MNALTRTLLKNIIPLAQENLPMVEKSIAEYIQSQELLPGENYVAAVLTSTKSGLMISLCAFSKNDELMRQIVSEPLNKFILQIINKI